MAFVPLGIHVRSYCEVSWLHSHDFAQLVLPLQGSLEFDLAGRGARLDRARAAYVPGGVRHDQISSVPNRFLIVDVPAGELDDTFAGCPFPAVTSAAAHLIDYMAESLPANGARAALWTPLLLDALTSQPFQPKSRLAVLLDEWSTVSTQAWTVGEMARRAQLSVSRLHAVFREEFDSTPRAWLDARRMETVSRWLAGTDLSLAEIASRAGFSDQSALTKAFRRATGRTPAVYRRQESGPKIR